MARAREIEDLKRQVKEKEARLKQEQVRIGIRRNSLGLLAPMMQEAFKKAGDSFSL